MLTRQKGEAGAGGRDPYNGNFATKLVLDFSLLDGIRSLLLDDLEELLDTHVGELGCVTVSNTVRVPLLC
jgi:hypothetical protein